MSICEAGIKSNISGGKIDIEINDTHPLLRLAGVISWETLSHLVLADLQKSTAKGQWWRGRKLKLRIHLGVFILQQIFNKTDRQIEYDVKDNAAYQLFCGRTIVDAWHCPDHTKIETFRSRISPETQRILANHISVLAVGLGFAEAANLDIDSTIQEANMTYPADVKLLTKLATMAAKVVPHLKKIVPDFIGHLEIDLKGIRTQARRYFFSSKKLKFEKKQDLLRGLWSLVSDPVLRIARVCKGLWNFQYEKLSWNVQRTIQQLTDHSGKYLYDVFLLMREKKRVPDKRLSFHLNEVACFNKGKFHKKYEFGRCYQLGRIGGNFMVAGPGTTVREPDKAAIQSMMVEHIKLFGTGVLASVATDKGYFSYENERKLIELGVKELGLQRPYNLKKLLAIEQTDEITQKLYNRRAGIEPLIGHIKHGGQLGRSRMKSDTTILASGYASVLGFNLRQTIRHQKGKYKKSSQSIKAACF